MAIGGCIISAKKLVPLCIVLKLQLTKKGLVMHALLC